jgi:uncharacterized membrane protein YfcA
LRQAAARKRQRSNLSSLLEALNLSTASLVAVGLAAFIGALVQGSIGFGLNLVVVPVVAIIEPAALPAAGIILALPMTLGSALREHTHIDRAGVVWMTLGRLPGVALGAWVVSVLTPETLALVIGVVVVAAVAMSLGSPPIRRRPRSQLAAGFMGGLMGTASSIGGPPVAILYQGAPGATLRSTLGATFLIGTVLSLLALGIAGQVDAFHWRFGGALVPPVLLGLWASRSLHDWLEAGWLRPCVLGFAALAGLAAVLRGVLGH